MPENVPTGDPPNAQIREQPCPSGCDHSQGRLGLCAAHAFGRSVRGGICGCPAGADLRYVPVHLSGKASTCTRCGALVRDHLIHDRWHEDIAGLLALEAIR